MAAKKDTLAAAVPAGSDKKKALETAMQQIEKMYGKGSIMRYGENAETNVEAIPTGSLALDLALGIGGVPQGRIIEIYGPESSGKTTLALHILAQAQKLGGEVAFVDAEHALDPTYARALGVEIEDMLISQPDTGEQALEITEALVRSGAIDVVVVDSVAALVPRAEIEGEMGDSFVGLHARLMSQALRKLTGVHRQDQLHRHLHQPAAGKGGRHVRQSRGHHRRPGSEVLCLRAHRRAPHRGFEVRRRDHRQPHPGQGGEKQGGAPLP